MFIRILLHNCNILQYYILILHMSNNIIISNIKNMINIYKILFYEVNNGIIYASLYQHI